LTIISKIVVDEMAAGGVKRLSQTTGNEVYLVTEPRKGGQVTAHPNTTPIFCR
jgi:hypothetical protein